MCGSRNGGATLLAKSGNVVISLFCGCLSSPESTGLSQLESMWGTAERDNDVWQLVVSMLHVFNCLVGNAASQCERDSQLFGGTPNVCSVTKCQSKS